LGWGGSCFGKDTAALVSTGKEYGLPMVITQAAKDVNSRQRMRMVEILANELKILKGRKIGILGLAFKPFTDDLRDAPALDVAMKLIDRGAKVVGFDPIAMDRAKKEWAGTELQFASSAEAVFEEADAVVLVTEWPEFLDLDFENLKKTMKNPFLLDGRNHFDVSALKNAGLKVTTLGRSS
jgi:UDPglucose 6-dehydrogenase